MAAAASALLGTHCGAEVTANKVNYVKAQSGSVVLALLGHLTV